jgi:drug/metabolite transporter (DMT)-like permease
MKTQGVKANIYLLITAAIWGLAFVAQRIGGQYVGSFTFNGVRFALGGLSIMPLMFYLDRKPHNQEAVKQASLKATIKPGLLLGVVLFAGAALQQIGLMYTSVGKAAFITGLYIVLVPVFGIFLKHSIPKSTWFGVAIAIVGLYLLSVTESFSVAFGDLLQMVGAIFWTAHILLIDHFTKKYDGIKLAFIQFMACSVFSLAAAIGFETITIQGLTQAVVPIFYGGVCSVGIAYTLQIVGQKHAKPSHAAIILSMEAVFASIGGLLILNENLGLRGYIGCIFMLAGMIASQLSSIGSNEPKALVDCNSTSSPSV